MLRRTYKFFMFRLSGLLVYVGVKVNAPPVSALGIRLALYRSNGFKKPHSYSTTLIVLAKSGGVEDIEAAVNGESLNIDVLFLPRIIIKKICYRYLTDASDYNYFHCEKNNPLGINAYREHLKAVIYSLQRGYFSRIAFLQFNVIYHAERELAFVCAQQSIPFITLQKEALRSNLAWRNMINIYQQSVGIYYGSTLIAYNQQTIDCLKHAGVLTLSDSCIVGAPRLDYSHQLRSDIRDYKEKSKDSYVLYYLIDPLAGFTNIMDRGKFIGRGIVNRTTSHRLSWNSMIELVNRTIVSLAERHPEIKILMKCKPEFAAIQAAMLPANLPKNCELIFSGLGHDLLKKASVVIGFNTTSLYEAIAAGVATVSPKILPVDPVLEAYRFELPDSTYQPTTGPELVKIVTELHFSNIRKRHLNPSEIDVLDSQLGNSDGLSGQRLRKALQEKLSILT